jgi:hypothetical protein
MSQYDVQVKRLKQKKYIHGQLNICLSTLPGFSISVLGPINSCTESDLLFPHTDD